MGHGVVTIHSGSYWIINTLDAIHYYKLDCITEVVTCLEFDYENGEYLEVNSTNEGWENLINGLHKYIPIQKENWKTNMLKCKLDDNGHTIYRRI
ncbi:hypothetical protein AF333_23925 [Aneurinibacillus migulanus]|uniref:Uncharacterized protein n=1 Tax=Aneurinibacillus migulanus TaxID=47500 RepID=A0A0M0H7H3_ANEMI|nr:hypothetical protein AF333_23925 [Aneurinibacillus migulanus]